MASTPFKKSSIPWLDWDEVILGFIFQCVATYSSSIKDEWNHQQWYFKKNHDGGFSGWTNTTVFEIPTFMALDIPWSAVVFIIIPEGITAVIWWFHPSPWTRFSSGRFSQRKTTEAQTGRIFLAFRILMMTSDSKVGHYYSSNTFAKYTTYISAWLFLLSSSYCPTFWRPFFLFLCFQINVSWNP